MRADRVNSPIDFHFDRLPILLVREEEEEIEAFLSGVFQCSIARDNGSHSLENSFLLRFIEEIEIKIHGESRESVENIRGCPALEAESGRKCCVRGDIFEYLQ